jgi:hypothetical protein
MRSASLKRDALLFHEIGITNLSVILSMVPDLREWPDPDIYDLPWLSEQRIVFELEPIDAIAPQTKESGKYSKLARKEGRKHEKALATYLLATPSVSGKKVPESILQTLQSNAEVLGLRAGDYEARWAAIRFGNLNKVQALPILTSRIPSSTKPQAEKVDVIQITLNALPQPSETVSWEQIVEIRSDPDYQHHWLALRDWMNETARAKLTPHEVEEKIEYLTSLYSQHMKLHRVKTNKRRLETVVVAGAEFLENLVKFKWGNIAKGLFSLKHTQIALLEGELSSPGHELAYIEKVRNSIKE